MHDLAKIPDDELVKRIIERDEHAFEILFDRYASILRYHVVNILHDETLTHDVVQETFIRIWTRSHQWRGTGPVKAWFFRTATNLALNQLRTIKRRREIPLEIPAEADDDEDYHRSVPASLIEASSAGPEAVVLAAEERSRTTSVYRKLLSQMPEEKRTVFRMVHEMEMSLRDTADTLQIPEGTVKSRLHYARINLAKAWRELEEGG